MSEFLLNYKRVDPTTWVYLSSLLSLGLFFKFNRFWSVRNLDLVLLIMLAPGLLLVHYGRLGQEKWVDAALGTPHIAAKIRSQSLDRPEDADEQPLETAPGNSAVLQPGAGLPGDTPGSATGNTPGAESNGAEDVAGGSPGAEQTEAELAEEAEIRKTHQKNHRAELMGFLWLLGVNLLLVIRMLVDPNMVRRPLLEPNLTSGGLTFICVSSFVFLMANVVASKPATPHSDSQLRMQKYLVDATVDEEPRTARRPGYALLTLFPQIPTTPLTVDADAVQPEERPADSNAALVAATRCIAIISHLAIVLGIATVGYRHFDSMKMGIGAATLYLMLPYTAQMTGYIEHSIPAALLVWAVVFYRRPATAGVFLGLAIGCYYYPLFLLPLWISFYWQRGLGRFLGGALSMLALLVVILMFKSSDTNEFLGSLRTMFGFWTPHMQDLEGVWGLAWDPWYRVPVLAMFFGMSITLAIWPAQKNLGTLVSCSGAVMVATQFWHGFGGGLYMGWYLPLLLLTIFRPNLEDRIALSVLGEGWFPRRRKKLAA